jgi:protein required for attachment to host cells
MQTRATLVLVADGAAARLFAVDAKARRLELIAEDSDRRAHRKTSEMVSDRAGRGFPQAHGPAHHGMEAPTDPKRHEKARFAAHLAERLEDAIEQRAAEAVVIVAAPRTLADLRADLSPRVAERVALEIDKDLTHEPVSDLEARLGDQLWGTHGIAWKKNP